MRTTPGPGTTPSRVLVVNDDERSGRELADPLRRDGFAAQARPGGLAGPQRLTAAPAPDVRVTDLRTPRIDGITVARRARTRSPMLPIPIVTAYPDLARRLAAEDPAPQIFIEPIADPARVGALRAPPRTA